MFTEDISLFFSQTEFAQSVTVDGVAMNGLLDREYREAGFTESLEPILFIQTSDAPSVAHDDTVVTEDSTNYKVIGVEPDGTGLTKLVLRAT